MVRRLSETEIVALADNALHAACYHIQRAIGQTAGDTAGVFFSGNNEEAIKAKFIEYIQLEQLDLADEAEHDDVLRLRLASCGNPDYGGDPSLSMPDVPDEWISVVSLTEASVKCRQFIDEHELGGGSWAGGEVKRNGVPVARISYNGRIWNPDGTEYVPPVLSDSERLVEAAGIKIGEHSGLFVWEAASVHGPDNAFITRNEAIDDAAKYAVEFARTFHDLSRKFMNSMCTNEKVEIVREAFTLAKREPDRETTPAKKPRSTPGLGM